MLMDSLQVAGNAIDGRRKCEGPEWSQAGTNVLAPQVVSDWIANQALLFSTRNIGFRCVEQLKTTVFGQAEKLSTSQKHFKNHPSSTSTTTTSFHQKTWAFAPGPSEPGGWRRLALGDLPKLRTSRPSGSSPDSMAGLVIAQPPTPFRPGVLRCLEGFWRVVGGAFWLFFGGFRRFLRT